ncbi:uncharacterized protein GGS22DRAFT_198651 [Annulohypoxylon maeteangense]|uniref:uncharacterized protein n=1 Tax=Annulohypoxylon maeteangense TaxID=1927788 RepID=UPI002008CA18|nr:uncharacterized protein GGS22DRAFT_198651 [Annulohypoxylon maeteangense]KAI0887321.1 hypothetical protein GGS22DRAFT_198651 [Annulohypoxylon maeteangense]
MFLEDINGFSYNGCNEKFCQVSSWLIPNLPHPAATRDPEFQHIVMVLTSWRAVPSLLNDQYCIHDSLSWRWPTAQNILTSVLERESSCSVCHPVVANALAGLYDAGDCQRKAKYWVQQNITELRKPQSLAREQKPKNHNSICQLVDFEVGYASRNETEGIAQNQNLIPSNYYQQKDHGTAWDQAIHSPGFFLTKLEPWRFEFLGFALLNTGILLLDCGSLPEIGPRTCTRQLCI